MTGIIHRRTEATRMLAAVGMLLIVAAAVFVPAPAEAGVTVRAVGAEKYRDGNAADAAEFRKLFERLSRHYLPPGANLRIDILDIDRAGEVEPWRMRLHDVRIMRGVTPPSIRLRYVLEGKGERRASGEETVTDMNYQMNSLQARHERLGYEKAMLTDWFIRRFGQR